MRRGGPLAADGLHLLVTQTLDDAVGDGIDLPLGPAGRDHEVIGERGQRRELEDDHVGRLLVLGQFDDATGEIERLALTALGGLLGSPRETVGLAGDGVRERGVGHVRWSLRWSWYSPWSPIYAATASGTR